MFSGGMKCFLESDYFFPHHCSVKHALLISCFKLVLQENPRLQNLFWISLFMCYMNHCLNITFLLFTAFHGTPPSVSHCWMNVLHPRSLCSRSNQSVHDPKVSTGISPDSPSQKVETFPIGLILKSGCEPTKAWESFEEQGVESTALSNVHP